MFVRTAGTVDPNREIGTSRTFPLSVTVAASTNAADATNTRRRREHLQMDPDLFRQLKAAGLINLNNHLMLTMGGYSVPLTVQILAPQSTITQVCIGVEALARFPGVSLPASGTLSGRRRSRTGGWPILRVPDGQRIEHDNACDRSACRQH
jgi:hypothetical protein